MFVLGSVEPTTAVELVLHQIYAHCEHAMGPIPRNESLTILNMCLASLTYALNDAPEESVVDNELTYATMNVIDLIDYVIASKKQTTMAA